MYIGYWTLNKYYYYSHPKMCRMALTTGRCDRKEGSYYHKAGTIRPVPNKPTPGPTKPTIHLMELNIPPHHSRNHKVSPPLTSTSQFHQQNPTTNQPQAQATRWDPFFRSNESNKTAYVRHAASPKQIASDHESSMAMFATCEGQLNPVNQAQPLLYSFIFLNIARLFTKSKPRAKLLHDLCTSSTLFLCICKTFLFDDINDCEIHLPDFKFDVTIFPARVVESVYI